MVLDPGRFGKRPVDRRGYEPMSHRRPHKYEEQTYESVYPQYRTHPGSVTHTHNLTPLRKPYTTNRTLRHSQQEYLRTPKIAH